MKIRFWKKEKGLGLNIGDFLNSSDFYNTYNAMTVEEQKLTRKKIVIAYDYLDEYRSALEYELKQHSVGSVE